ncbi:MAG TPA: ATPase domain-containing protein, partial [Thermoanaerobaculia bacterium]|nr:ATPase domain-containing protein [Thermoanaerobaculia bacterium]
MTETAPAGSMGNDPEIVSTGIPGLDEILRGGLPRDYVYLVQGDPGAGKTTLAMQFLLAGDRKGEKGLYLTLSESAREIRRVAVSHEWKLGKLEIYEQLVGEDLLRHERTTMFHPAEVELGKTVDALLQEIDRVQPQRVVLDSLSEIRLLSQSTFRYRRQILALKEFFASRRMTVLLLDDRTESSHDLQLHSVPHGVLLLERRAPLYGAARRRLEVVKLRGVGYRGGFHDFSIVKGGLIVYPRLIAAERRQNYSEPTVENDQLADEAVDRRQQLEHGSLSSEVPEIDALLGGGLDLGSSTIILGPAGAGKSSLAAQYATAAAKQGEIAAMFIFDESRKSLVARSESINIGLKEQLASGRLTAKQIDPAELPPGEFAHLVRLAVERDGARVIVIDSLNGYLNAMPEERFLTLHLHELLSYLSERGVATI